jgi:tetratricopeptide (TPR) repeat protein
MSTARTQFIMSKKKTLLIVLTGVIVATGALFAVRAASSNPDRILSRADKHFEAKAFDEARLEYLKALRAEPMNARAIRQLGLIWAEMGAHVQASVFLAKACELEPDDVTLRHALAKALLATNQYALTRTAALALLEKNPKDGEAILLLTNSSFSPEQIDEVNVRLEAFEPEKSPHFHLASAFISGRKGDLPGAKSSLDMALAIDPQFDTVHLAIANYHEAKKDPAAMLESLKKASELSSDRSPGRLLYARALARVGKTEEAVSMIRKITETSRYYLPAWTTLAELTLPSKDTKGALAMLNEVLNRDATNPEARLLRSTVLQSDGKTADAAKELEEMSRIYRGNLGVKMSLARSYIANSDFIKAAATLEEILRAVPNNLEATLLQAQMSIKNGDAGAGSNALEAFLQRQPGLPPARLQEVETLLAGAYKAQGRFDDAVGVFRKQAGRIPNDPTPQFLLGMILRQQGKDAEALITLEKAQALAPKDQAIAFELVGIEMASRNFVSAHRRAQEQAGHHPGDSSPLYLQGKIFTAEEKWDDAEKVLLKALAINPDSLNIYNLLLDGYLKQGRTAEVITRLEAYLEQKPKSTPQRLILALLYQQSNNVEKQAAAYEQVLRDDPNMVTALNNLAYLYAGPLNDLVKAQEMAARARTAQPDNPAVADTLGWILFQRKDYAQALLLTEEAAAKIPDNAEIQYHLGMARYMQGQKETARTALEKAVAAKQPFPGIEQAKEYLGQLTGDGTAEQGATIESLTLRLKDTPGDVTARTRLAQLQETAGQFPEAAANYHEALKGNAGLIEALLALSRLHAGPLADPALATDFAKRARALDGRNPAAARALGEAVLHQGDFRYAFTLLQEAQSASKDDPGLKTKLASAAYATGQTEQARRLMQEITAAPGEAPEKAAAQRFLTLTGEPTPAATVAAVAEALKENPDDLPALMTQASLFVQDGKTSDALASLEQVLKKQPEFVPVWKQLAALLATQEGRLDEAQTLAEKARQALPEDPALARTLGIILCRKESFEPAISLLKESAAKAPLDAAGLFYLGTSQLGAGQKDDGVATLKRAVETTGLPESLKQQAQETLAKIEAADQPAP